MFSALLDTSVLWPSLQRDFLLSLAIEGLYRPLWSDAILEELEFHEAEKLVGRGTSRAEASEKAARLVEQMRIAFDDAIVAGWEPLEGTYGLPDADDEHVVAAAVIGGAGAIVTENLRDFPSSDVPSHVDVQTARAFAANTVSVDPDRAAHALREIAGRHRNPTHTPLQLLDILVTRYGMTDVDELLRPLLASS